MYSYGPPHMAGQKQDDQLEHTFSSYVRIRDVALKTYRRWWTIGRSGERGSGISVPVARHDDDNIYIYIYIYIYPTPPYKPDVTLGQFFRWTRFFFSLTSCHTKVRVHSAQLFTNSWRENHWIYIFAQSISAMWNANHLIQDLNSGCHVHFLHW